MKNKANLILYISIFIYILTFGILSLLRHYTYRTGPEVACYSQCIWSVLKGKWLYTTLYRFAIDSSSCVLRVSPILILFSPFYLIWNNPQMALILQVIAFGISALPIYWLAASRLKNKWWALCIAESYLFYPGQQYANLFDFQPVSLVIPFMLFAIYYFSSKKYVLFLLFIILSMMCKSHICFIVFMFGGYLIFRNWQNNKIEMKIGILLLLISFLWMIYSFGFCIHHLNNTGVYSQLEQNFLRYEYLGLSYGEILKNMFFHPNLVFKNLFTIHKIKHFVAIFIPLGFLPLLSFKAIILLLPLLTIHFLSNDIVMYAISFGHHIDAFIPFLFWGIIEAIDFLNKKIKIKYKILLPYCLLFLTIFTNTLLSSSPISRYFNFKRYKITERHHKLDKMIKLIPDNASVIADINIAAHLSHREKIYYFPPNEENNVEYIIMDTLNAPLEKEVINKLIITNKYKKIYEEEDLILLKRN